MTTTESYIVSKLSSDDNLIRQSVATTAVEKFVNSFFSESGKVSSIETWNGEITWRVEANIKHL